MLHLNCTSLSQSESGSFFMFIIIVATGDHDLNGQEGYEQKNPIEKIITHPDYAPHNSHDYDLALIKLKSPLTYNKRVRPVCFPKFDFPSGTKCYVTGWGHTAEGGDIAQVTEAMIEK